MKYFLIFLVLAGFAVISSTSIVYGMWLPQSTEDLFEQSETVFVGTIIFVNVLEFERSNTYTVEENGIPRIIIENYTQALDEYTVDIEEFLKNPQESQTMTMLEATVGGVPGLSVSIGGFELGDRVLFYVPKIDGINQYSPESFKIPKQCDAKTVLEKPRIEMGNSFNMIQEGVKKEDNFTANKSVEFVYQRDMRTLDEKNFDFQITIRKETDTNKFDELVLSEKIPSKSVLCEWISTAKTEFTPQSGNYTMWVNIIEGTGIDIFSGSFSVRDNFMNYHTEIISPLKQFKSGIPSEQISCKEGLEIALKKNNRHPSCLTPDTKEKLIQRGWAEPLGNIIKQRSGYAETTTESSEEYPVLSLPFGMIQQDIEFQPHVDPIYIENPNNPEELILDIDSMIQVQKILDKCDYKQKLESGEIPPRNPDGSHNAVTGELRFYNNGTHYIDSNGCKWIDSLEAITYNCFEANPMEQNWYFGPDYFDNGTHYIDVQNCEWTENEN